jgi:putative transcriptional regulator
MSRRVAPGRLLIAQPSLGDANFMRSVIYVLEHNSSGSLGLIINRPLEVVLGNLWDDCPPPLVQARLCGEGGPVDRHKGLLLHAVPSLAGSFDLGIGLALGGDRQALLQHFANGPDETGPRLFLGHAGWGPGQLESEVADGAWLLRDGHPRLLLDAEPPDDLWAGLIAAGEEPAEPSVN